MAKWQKLPFGLIVVRNALRLNTAKPAFVVIPNI